VYGSVLNQIREADIKLLLYLLQPVDDVLQPVVLGPPLFTETHHDRAISTAIVFTSVSVGFGPCTGVMKAEADGCPCLIVTASVGAHEQS